MLRQLKADVVDTFKFDFLSLPRREQVQCIHVTDQASDIEQICTGVQKSCEQNCKGDVGRPDFWTTVGHPDYIGLFGAFLPLWTTLHYFGYFGPLSPINLVSQRDPQVL